MSYEKAYTIQAEIMMLEAAVVRPYNLSYSDSWSPSPAVISLHFLGFINISLSPFLQNLFWKPLT